MARVIRNGCASRIGWPSRAAVSSAIFFRACPRASWATSPALNWPATRASHMSWPERPNTSLSTSPIFTLASSHTFCTRWRSSAAAPDHLLAAPREVPQFALRPRRNAAGTNHSVTQPVRQPARLVRVGLVPGNGLDLLRIGQHYCEPILWIVLQNVQHRLPVTAGALHHHVPTALAFEPLSSAFQFRLNRAELLSSAVAFSAAGPVITQTARNFLPTSMPAHPPITAEIIQPPAAWAGRRLPVQIVLRAE